MATALPNNEIEAENEANESLPPTLTTLQCEPEEIGERMEIDELCESKWKQYICTQEQITKLEEETRDQSVNPLWREHRKGRITGTLAHSVLVMRETTNPENCIKRILGYSIRDISGLEAVKWGTENEEEARNRYVSELTNTHSNFSCRLAGLKISNEKVFLAASTDGVVSCDCCGNGCLEIKCPFNFRDETVEVAVQDKTFCMDPDFKLKEKHKYFTQVQLQMFVHDFRYCDFVIFTRNDLKVQRIPRDDSFCQKLIDRCEEFFHKYVLPELITCEIGNTLLDKDKNTD